MASLLALFLAIFEQKLLFIKLELIAKSANQDIGKVVETRGIAKL